MSEHLKYLRNLLTVAEYVMSELVCQKSISIVIWALSTGAASFQLQLIRIDGDWNALAFVIVDLLLSEGIASFRTSLRQNFSPSGSTAGICLGSDHL